MLSLDYLLRRGLTFFVTRQLGPLLKSEVRGKGGRTRDGGVMMETRPRATPCPPVPPSRHNGVHCVRARRLPSLLCRPLTPAPFFAQVDASSLSLALADGAATSAAPPK